MPESDKRPLNWDIQLNFEHLEARREEPVAVTKVPPRQIIGEKFPKILERIELLWCSLELHRYLEQTLFTDRSNRQGFPKDVMQALGEIHVEHTRILKLKKMISEDVWDI